MTPDSARVIKPGTQIFADGYLNPDPAHPFIFPHREKARVEQIDLEHRQFEVVFPDRDAPSNLPVPFDMAHLQSSAGGYGTRSGA